MKNLCLDRFVESGLENIKMNLDNIPHIIQLEEEYPPVRTRQLPKKFLEYSLEQLLILEKFSNNLENKKYFSRNKVLKYNKTIWKFREKIRRISDGHCLGI